MAMTINTNISSINAQRNLGLSGGSLATSMQRISSGLRVNSAKDDAAGLAISERMNSQVRGLTVAARNANDGISLAQTAEGALGKVGDMLGRMRDLAVQAGNSTNSKSDREALQSEVDQLRSEIDRVAKTTTFNGQKILDGSFAGGVFQVGANSGDNITVKGTTDATAAGLGNVTFGSTTSKNLNAANVTDFDKALSGLKISVGAKSYDLKDLKAASTGQERLGQMVAAINEKTADTGVTAYLQETATAGTYTIALKSSSSEVVRLQGFDSLNAAAGVPSTTIAASPNTNYNTAKTAYTNAVTAFKATPGTSDTATNAEAIVTAAKALLPTLDGYSATGSTGAAKALEDQIATLTPHFTPATTAPVAAAAWGTGGQAAFTSALDDMDLAAVETADTAARTAAATAAYSTSTVAGLKLDKTATTTDVNAAITAINNARTAAGMSGPLATTALTVPGGTSAADEAKLVADKVAALQSELDPLGLTVAGSEVTAHKGLDGVDVSTQAGAWEAIKSIDSAIDQVNSSRGDLGALQTRFEKSVENIDIMNENLSAARGRIVDADFAKETANLSRTQILQQAGTAMVAQANQLPQQVLSLLR
ncbi:flagellin [Comamonas thiooxydans]|uniref:flagellin N-terminal helical domain-containing protein n=1 Tax=Comamonas thiooxydans TaxID=363952 RepID=UPI00220555E9|nr:flagellin [Comamonas thiooxydans]BDB68047.1 flagellin [Comamonas thiooxydans]